MKELISYTINKINDKSCGEQYFFDKVVQDIVLPEEVSEFLLDINAMIKEQRYGTDLWPSKEWIIKFVQKSKGLFNVRYKTIIMISKLAPFFYLQHEFDVDNVDDDCISPTLDGFDNQPYSKSQMLLHELVKEQFEKIGYTELSYREMNEVIPGLSFKEGVTIFGPQVTVEHALFRDVNEFTREQ